MRHVVPMGLILLVGPPAAGKSSFARAWVSLGRIGADAVVSCDAIRAEMFGEVVRIADDPAVFAEMDRRVLACLAAGLPAVVDATNVTTPARHRMIAHGRLHSRSVTALRFSVPDAEILARNATRRGHHRVPDADVLHYADIFRTNATRDQLLADGIDVVFDVADTSDAEHFEVLSTHSPGRARVTFWWAPARCPRERRFGPTTAGEI